MRRLALAIISVLDRLVRILVATTLLLSASGSPGPTSLAHASASVAAQAAPIPTPSSTGSPAPTTTEIAPPTGTTAWTPEPPNTATPSSGYPGPVGTPTPPANTPTPVPATPTPAITPIVTITAPAPLPVTATVTSLGGEIAYGQFGELRLIFPADVVTQPVTVAVAPLAQLPGPFPFSAVYQGYGVDVQIHQVLAGAPVSQTARPMTVTLQTQGLWPELNAASLRVLALYHYDASEQVWERLPTDGDPATGVLTATLSSFSPIAVGASPQTSVGDYARPWQPNIPNYSVDTFTGAVNWRIPIEFPQGRGSLAPDLALVYNTANVDELRGTANPQTPGIGMGWSLSVPYIERVAQWEPTNVYSTPQAAKNSTGQYRIVMNGISGDLVCFSGDNPCTEFRTKDERFWKVLRKTDHPPMGGAWDGNGALSGEYWLVYSPDGMQYRFGYSRNASDGGQYSAWFMFVQLTDDGYRIAPAIWRWNLDTTTDRYGNTIWYQYSVETRDYFVDNGSACWATWQLTGCTLLGPGPYVRWGYLSQIDWTVGGATGFNNPYQVTFDVQVASNSYASQLDGWTQYETFYSKYLYKTINVSQRVSGAMTPFRKYVLDNAVDGNGVLKLNSVQEKNGDGTAALPATTFNYHPYPPYRTSSCSGADQWTNDKVYLDTVNNGYGGVVSFNYTKPEYDSIKYWHNNGQTGADNTQNGQTCDSTADSQGRYWMRYRIRRVKVEPGVGPIQATVYEYRNQANNGVDGGEWKYAHPQYPWQQAREFRGHPVVRVFQLDIASGSDPVVAYQDLFYYKGIPDTPGSPLADTCGQALPSDVEGLQGSLYKQISYDVAGNPLAGAVTQYLFKSLSNGRRFVVARAQCDYAGSIGSSASRRAESDYETTYGQVTQQREYNLATATTQYRTITTTYGVNTSAWVVSLPIEQKTFAGAATGTLLSHTRYHYAQDAQGNLVWGTIPVSSITTAVERVNVQGGPSAIERSWLDAYGNITKTVDARGYPATWAFDSLHIQFPVSVCNALNQCATTEYYGVNASGAPAGGGNVGQVWQVYDANGAAAATQLVHDVFGRVVKVIRPGDSVVTPTVQYNYFDAAFPLKVETLQRETSGCDACVLSTLQFYDGLGRAIQTRAESGDGAVQSVASVTYDALGRPQRQYLPVTEAYTTTYSTPSGLFTQTQYDALGRTVAITNTDNTVLKSAYSGWQTAALDANGHQRISIADAFGRVVTVKEFSPTFANPDFNAAAYATTLYGYSPLDQLVAVTDTLGVTTTITYDSLGRKTEMRDPDMGWWRYGYDLAGNLITQTNALNQVLWFKYDALNRLTEKRLTGSAGPLLAQFAYDTGPYGVGYRTLMTDTSGAAAWGYDARGRMVTETRTITGINIFTTTYAYDAADRPAYVTYPTGETVWQTYDAAGRLSGLGGLDHYAASLTYNALGQLKQLSLGSGAVTTWDYYDGVSIGGPTSHRLWPLKVQFNSTSLMELQYRYDNGGNILALTDTVNANQVQTFTYDALDRLLTASTNAAGTGQYSESYAYDAVGNMTSKAGTAYAYNDAAHRHAVTHLAGAQRFWYDANGSMAKRIEGSATYTQSFDVESRLITVTSSLSGTTAFRYDGDGRRVLLTAPNGDRTAYVGELLEVFVPALMPTPPPTPAPAPPITGTFRSYLPAVMKNFQVLRTVPAGQTWTSYYFAAGQPVAMRAAFSNTTTTLYYLHGDHLGSLSLVTSYTGTVISRQGYLPYGEIRPGAIGAMPTTLGFTAQRRDSGLGSLMYYRARFFSPAIGRFVSPDTIVPEPANPQALNRYAYVYNNPILYTDPSGHCPLCIVGVLVLLKVIDYGWTAYDAYQSGVTLANPNASDEDRLVAGINVALSVGMEGAEPDDLSPVSLPLDDVARRGILLGLRESIQAGGLKAGVRFVVDSFGNTAPGVIRYLYDQGLFRGIKSYDEWGDILMGVRQGANLQVHHLIEKQYSNIVGMDRGDIPSVVLDSVAHNGPASASSPLCQDRLGHSSPII